MSRGLVVGEIGLSKSRYIDLLNTEIKLGEIATIIMECHRTGLPKFTDTLTPRLVAILEREE